MWSFMQFPHLLGTQEDSLKADRLTNGLEESMGAKGKRRPRPIFSLSLPPAPNNLNSYVVLGKDFCDAFFSDQPIGGF